MMTVPFYGFFLALALVLAGQRRASMLVWAASLLAMLVLFKMHATDPLNLVL
ncbi:DUF5993 family protein [Xanthobacter sp. DSM 24535]|uniref:DUF5993 family protein n=1 Tax=Roseixanthobacter psychrophilus TaxID=3119917 RepID=UPI00372810AD